MIVDLVLSNAKAYVNKEILDCSLAIDQGKIFKISKETNMPKAETRINLRNLLVLPGLIDVHVHLRDEGKAYKEDFHSGTAAAAAGGITTVLDMPNNKPVTMSVENLRRRMEIAQRKILVNVGFYCEFPKNLKEIEEIVSEGAIAFKLFMAEQIGGLNVNDNHAILEAFETVSRQDVPVAVHAEDKTALEKTRNEFRHANRNNIEDFINVHSANVEANAVQRLLKITGQTGVHMHFCHITTKSALKAIIDGKESGMPITCETTPHNLFLSTNNLRRIGTLALTMPPIREKHHVAALWNGIENGWIDILASDHAPHTRDEKGAKSVWDVGVGIPGLETTLPLLLTKAKRGCLSITDIVRLMSENPAEIFGLAGRGCLKEGNNADLTVVNLGSKCKIDTSKFHSKAKFSPFDGWNVEGKPVKTFVGGELIMDGGEVVAEAGSGHVIRRE